MKQRLMKAVLLHGYGDVNQLSYEDAPSRYRQPEKYW